MRGLRGLSAQLLLFIVLPLFLALSAIAVGSAVVHQRSMRAVIGERDLRAVLAAAAGLATPAGRPDSQRIQAVLDPLQASPETAVRLADAQGRIVYGTSPQEVGQASSHPGVAKALAGQSGLLYRADRPGGPEHVVAYAPVPVAAQTGQTIDWALVVEEPWSQVLSPWLRLTLFAPLILVVAVASTLLALWLAVQRVIHPLQRLDAQVTALGWGDFEAVTTPVGGIQEIQELQGALTRMAAQIRAYQQSMRGFLGAVTAAQEDERKRLARELHDETVQDLIALKQRVQMARRKAAHEPGDLDERFAELQAMLESTMDEVRRFSRALRPIYLEEAGLVAALEALARDANQDALQVMYEVEGQVRRLAPDTELALYRIVQEALHNAVRHAQASNVHISLTFEDDVAVQVRDDGTGFVPPQRVSDLVEAGHYGLMGMHERAQLVGAHLVIRSHPGAGTTIEAHVHPRKPHD
ncbi:MAG: histidine kinase [Anaerolineae bacterium]|nr:histidine kinase [Anaerolineae bacterium]